MYEYVYILQNLYNLFGKYYFKNQSVRLIHTSGTTKF